MDAQATDIKELLNDMVYEFILLIQSRVWLVAVTTFYVGIKNPEMFRKEKVLENLYARRAKC
jgi:hypothetical protein